VCVCWHCRGTAGTAGIYRTTRGARTATCAFCVGVIGHPVCGLRRDTCAEQFYDQCCVFAVRCGSHGFAAGITWTSRTLQAEWAGRQGHTSVIDAAGAIYVIGGAGNGTYYQDVWTNGGMDRTESRVLEGIHRLLRGTKGK
jgi:hypothetical protein